MPIKDILLLLDNHPAPTSLDAIEKAIELSRLFDAHICALTFELNIHSPIGFYWDPLHLGSVFAEETRKSAAVARDLIAAFESAASRHGVSHDHVIIKDCLPNDVPVFLVDHARLRDLIILPQQENPGSSPGKAQDHTFDYELQRRDAESLIFASGRPVLLLPERPRRPLPASFDTAVIAWDHSRPSARAVADALPFLQRAKGVKILTVVGEKPLSKSFSGAALREHLARHQIKAEFEERPAQGRPIGEILEAYSAEHAIDLLVMGAYGHSRLREFVLGGATRTVLQHPIGWTLLSH